MGRPKRRGASMMLRRPKSSSLPHDVAGAAKLLCGAPAYCAQAASVLLVTYAQMAAGGGGGCLGRSSLNLGRRSSGPTPELGTHREAIRRADITLSPITRGATLTNHSGYSWGR